MFGNVSSANDDTGDDEFGGTDGDGDNDVDEEANCSLDDEKCVSDLF